MPIAKSSKASPRDKRMRRKGKKSASVPLCYSIAAMQPRWSCLLFLGLLLCLVSSSLAQQEPMAVLLESQQGSLCDADCPPIPLPNIYGEYLYCFRAGDQILIGQHQAWEMGLKRLASLQGSALLIHYDETYIWVKLPNGSRVRLSQYDFEYPFKNKSCRDAAQMRSLQHAYTRPQPVPGPAVPIIRGKLVSGWALCSPLFGNNFSNCTVWDLKGDIRQKRLFHQMNELNSSSQRSSWGRGDEENFTLIHLKDGRTLQAYKVPLKDQEIGTN
jgi:hypothetical protein